MDELEIMRQQCAALKQRLDTQQIINKDLMRNVMRGKASWLNNYVIGETIAMPFLMLIILAGCLLFGVSIWYAVAFLILGGIDTAFDWRTMRIPSEAICTASIIDLRKLLMRQKRERMIQICISTPLAIIWCIMLCMNIFTTRESVMPAEYYESFNRGGIIGLWVGIAVAIIIIAVIYVKMQRTNDQLLRDIRELESEE